MFSFTSGITIVVEEYSGSMIKATLSFGRASISYFVKWLPILIYLMFPHYIEMMNTTDVVLYPSYRIRRHLGLSPYCDDRFDHLV